MSISAHPLAEVFAVGFTQGVNPCVAILRPCLPVFIAGSTIKTGLFCQNHRPFSQ